MPQEIYTHTFPNGLTLLAERMPFVRSAAFNIMVPPVRRTIRQNTRTGLYSDGHGHARAGTRDSRALTEALTDWVSIAREPPGSSTCISLRGIVP
jgi:hypothetical protein